MLDAISKIVVVLNNFEKADKILEKALTLSIHQKAVLEILYVHEEPLFDLPDYFRLKDSIGDDFIDKEKIKKEIKERLSKLGRSEDCAILVFVDDTVDRVLTQTKEPNETLVVTAYEDKITEKLLTKSDASFLVIKNDKKSYEDIVMPVDLSENSLACIRVAKMLFPQSKIRLLYDNYYIFLDEVKEKEKALFETLKKETNLEGDYIQEHVVTEIEFVDEMYAIEKHLAAFIKMHNFDLIILYSHHRDFAFSESISFALLEMLHSDILLLKNHHERV